MLDGAARRLIGPQLDRLGAALARRGVTADGVTWAGFALGPRSRRARSPRNSTRSVLPSSWRAASATALDGAVARHSAATDRGGFLDIVLDFAFYGAIPLAFVLAEPGGERRRRRVPALQLLRQRRELPRLLADGGEARAVGEARGPKSLYFTTGLAEATETIAAFCLFCLFPDAFAPIAYVFAAPASSPPRRGSRWRSGCSDEAQSARIGVPEAGDRQCADQVPA